MGEDKSIELSVIIPTYNRKESLKECILSFENQDYPRGKYEVIVIDDDSSDGTSEMLTGFAKNYNNLRHLHQLRKGPAAARNLGLKEARAEIVSFTDNDCIPEKGWVRKIIETHKSEADAKVIGGFTEINPRNIKAVVSQFLSDGARTINLNKKTEYIFFPTCNVSLKKQYLDEEFNELFLLPAGEDLEFFWRIFKKGYRFIYNQDIKILHNCHSDFKSFLKQAYVYGRGNYLVKYIHQDHPLLKEIKTQNSVFFTFGTIINFIKIPRFSYLLGKRLISLRNHFNRFEKFQIYIYFTLHKVAYLIGNIAEHRRIVRLGRDNLEKNYVHKESTIKPEYIILDITHRCNIKCNICEIRKDKKIAEFSTDEVKGLIDQAIDWGIKEFVLSGGEPLIREDIFKILDFVREKNYRIGILTNGILLSENFIKILLPYLISNTLSLSISLDTLTPQIHDDIRGTKGCFEKTLSGLKILSELKNNYSNINFNIISIILNENLEELLPLANFLKSLNVNSIQFQPLLANNLIMKERIKKVKYWVPQERLPVLDRTVDSLIEFKRYNFSLVRNSENNLRLVKKYFQGLLTQSDIKCLYATRTMLIANNGDVTTCFDCYGNVRSKSLRHIFYSTLAERAREKVGSCKQPCLLPCFVD